MIRRGKIRNRPYLWHAARFASAGRHRHTWFHRLVRAPRSPLLFQRASISRNYWQEANDARQAPEEDAAWPLYREAIIKLGDPAQKEEHPRVEGDWIEAGRGGPHWAELKAIVERNQESIRLAHEGAKKPRLGYLLGDPRDHEFYRAAGATWLIKPDAPTVDSNVPLCSVLLTGIDRLRGLLQLLRADAAVAAEAGDGSRAVEDFIALLRSANKPSSRTAFSSSR